MEIYNQIYGQLKQIMPEIREKNGNNLSLNILAPAFSSEEISNLQEIADAFFIYLNCKECATSKEMLETIDILNQDKQCHGIYINSLSQDMEKDKSLIYSLLFPQKDVGIMNPVSLGLILHYNYFIFPPIIETLWYILKETKVELLNTSVVIIDNFSTISNILASILVSKGCIVTNCNVLNEYQYYVNNSDVIIALADCEIKRMNVDSVYLNFSNNQAKKVAYYFGKDEILKLLYLCIFYNFVRLINLSGEKSVKQA